MKNRLTDENEHNAEQKETVKPILQTEKTNSSTKPIKPSTKPTSTNLTLKQALQNVNEKFCFFLLEILFFED